MADDGFRPVKSADRTLDILELLASGSTGRSLAQLQRELAIPKSSLHGLLRTLTRRHWVETDESGIVFKIGRRAMNVSAAYLDSDDIVAAAQPCIDWLSAELGETVHLGRLDGDQVVYLAKRESRHPLRMYSAVGRRLPAHATALGKALLAQRRDAQVDELLPKVLPALTPNTLVDRPSLFEDLEATRDRGYAIDREENAEGIQCFAIAIMMEFPPNDAISLSIPTARINPALTRDVVQLLQQAQQRFAGSGLWRVNA